MNKDIRLAVGFFEHPKTIKLQRRLGVEATLALLKLWLWAAQHRPDGVLTNMDTEDIEIAAGWQGEHGALYSELVNLSWLDGNGGDQPHVLHDWEDHNPWQAESQSRSNSSRLSRMARDFPEAHKTLVDAGITGVTEKEYRLIRDSNGSSTVVSTVVQRSLTSRTSPSPTPTPTPVPEPSSKKDSSLRSESSCHGSVEPDEDSGSHVEIVQAIKKPQEAVKPKTKPARPRVTFPPESEPYRLAKYMRDELVAVLPTFHDPDLQNWAKDFDVALRNDERMKDPRFVAQVIKWVANDGFWRCNCQCPNTLRKQFDKLTAKMEQEAKQARASPGGRYKSPAQKRLEANQDAVQAFVTGNY